MFLIAGTPRFVPCLTYRTPAIGDVVCRGVVYHDELETGERLIQDLRIASGSVFARSWIGRTTLTAAGGDPASPSSPFVFDLPMMIDDRHVFGATRLSFPRRV